MFLLRFGFFLTKLRKPRLLFNWSGDFTLICVLLQRDLIAHVALTHKFTNFLRVKLIKFASHLLVEVGCIKLVLNLRDAPPLLLLLLLRRLLVFVNICSSLNTI